MKCKIVIEIDNGSILHQESAQKFVDSLTSDNKRNKELLECSLGFKVNKVSLETEDDEFAKQYDPITVAEVLEMQNKFQLEYIPKMVAAIIKEIHKGQEDDLK